MPEIAYTMVLGAVLNPLGPRPLPSAINNQLWIIKAAASNEFSQQGSAYSVYAVSQPYHANYRMKDYQTNEQQTQLYLHTNEPSPKAIEVLHLVNGVVSDELCVALKNQQGVPLPRSFVLSLYESSAVAIANGSAVVFSGTVSKCFRLRAFRGKGETILLFQTRGDGGLYQLLALDVLVSMSYRSELLLKNTQFTVFRGRTTWLLLNSLQLFDPSITAQARSNSGIASIRPPSITFSFITTRAVLAIDLPDDTGTTTEEIITLTFPDPENRALQTQLHLTILDATQAPGASSQLVVSAVQPSTNSVTMTVSCPQYSYLQYSLAKSYGDDSKLCTRGKEQLGAILFPELFEVVDDDYHLKSYAAYYDCAFVEGVLEFSSSQAQTLELNNLVASTAYQLDLACILPVSQGPSSRRYRTLEQAQTLYSHTTFETVTNDARCQKLRVRFERSLIKEETQAFACMLAMRFAADPRLVVSDNGLQCNFLLEQIGNPFPHLSTGLGANEAYFFIGKHLHLATDHIAPQIQQASADVPALIAALNEGLQGLPRIQSLEILSAVEDIPAEPQNTPTATTGYTWAYLSPLTLDKDAWVYWGLRQGSATSITSRELILANTFLQRMQVYTKSVEFKLTLLQPNTTYTIYLLATTDDPFEQARKASQIKTLTFTTKSFMILPNTSHMVLVTITTLLFLFLS